MRWILGLFVFLVFSGNLFSQNLTQEKIRKILMKKTAYVETGIFHNGQGKVISSLKSMRHSFTPREGFERLVFDFSTNNLPRIYGHFNAKEKKVSIDFFNTTVDSAIQSVGKTRYVDEIKFFPISEESLSVEIALKENCAADIFYLENPARLVIDFKK